MIAFIAIAVLMAALTVALLTRPLWQQRQASAPSADALREQLKQLESLRASGALPDAQAAQARAALEQRLAAAAPDAASDGAPAHAGSRLLLPALSVFVVLVTGAGYGWLGNLRALDPAQREAGAGEPGVTAEQFEAMVEKLAARLKDEPDNVQGWAMLGRSYAVLGRHAEALPAFQKAVALQPNDAMVLADYADALALANNRNLEGEPLKLIERALAIDPANLKALSLAGTAAFLRKDYALALRHWDKMAQIDPNSDFTRQIQPGIEEARRLAGGGEPTTSVRADPNANHAPADVPRPAADTPADAARSAVRGTVTLAASLAAKAAPEDTLFVFARAVDGPRVPLAILRKQVKDLPLTFTLDDSMAMTPEARLSSANQVIVGARISKRGNAMPQPGDLQGQSAPVAPGARNVAIEIGQVVGP